MNSEAFNQGFAAKCAERGISAEKMAQMGLRNMGMGLMGAVPALQRGAAALGNATAGIKTPSLSGMGTALGQRMRGNPEEAYARTSALNRMATPAAGPQKLNPAMVTGKPLAAGTQAVGTGDMARHGAATPDNSVGGMINQGAGKAPSALNPPKMPSRMSGQA